MPLYEYKCDLCGKTQEFLRPVVRRNAPPLCYHAPRGAGGGGFRLINPSPMTRVFSVPAPMPSSADRPGRGRG